MDQYWRNRIRLKFYCKKLLYYKSSYCTGYFKGLHSGFQGENTTYERQRSATGGEFSVEIRSRLRDITVSNKFEVNIFNNKRDIMECQKFSWDVDPLWLR